MTETTSAVLTYNLRQVKTFDVAQNRVREASPEELASFKEAVEEQARLDGVEVLFEIDSAPSLESPFGNPANFAQDVAKNTFQAAQNIREAMMANARQAMEAHNASAIAKFSAQLLAQA